MRRDTGTGLSHDERDERSLLMSYLRFRYFSRGNFPLLFGDPAVILIAGIKNRFIFLSYLIYNGCFMVATLNGNNNSANVLEGFPLHLPLQKHAKY